MDAPGAPARPSRAAVLATPPSPAVGALWPLPPEEPALRVGADPGCSYPRAGGVVIPPELARYCEGVPVPPRARAAESAASAELARAAARTVVQRMTRAAYALPRHLLESTLPSPPIVLRTLVLDERTRRVLERAAPFSEATTWTLGAYLGLPRFGPFCLVDLLSARAEAASGLAPADPRGEAAGGRVRDAAGGPGPAAGQVIPLDELSSLLMRRMPLGGDRIATLLGRDGVSQPAPVVRELARAYRRAGRTLPFRVIRHAGCEVVVAPSVRNVAKTVLVSATQFISWWGLTTVQQIVTRAQLRAASSVNAAFAGRVLASFPRIVWLDQSREWFSFRGNGSALLRAIKKAFAAADRLDLASLGKALMRQKAPLAKLPAEVWERYLSAIAGCTVDGIWVRRRPGDDGLCPA